jgi:PAS domain S-box-containing protein/putative nucleotidyltransferase with HDIG domain
MSDPHAQPILAKALANELIAHMPDVVLVLSYPDLRLIYANDAGHALLHDLLGNNDPDRDKLRANVHADKLADWQRYITETVQRGRREYTHSGIDGRQWLLHTSRWPAKGPCTAITLTATDISEIADTRQRLTSSDLNYRTLFETMNAGVVYHSSDGTVINVNPAAEAILGFKAADIIGWNPLKARSYTINEDGSFCKPEDHPLALALRTRQQQDNRLLGVPRPDGSRRWVRLSARPVISPIDGALESLVVCFHDVTDEQELRRSNDAQIEQLDRALEQSLLAMAEIIELRDPYTAGHQQNVASLADGIAREMGLGEKRCRLVRLAGLVHDIGKNAVPAEILAKPSTLSTLEHDFVKLHVEAGYQVLAGIEFAQPVAEIMRQHHERLDGSGYPRGLSGNEVLLEARILAVADTVDAMANHRPYRPARGMPAALAVLEQAAGVHYDSDVVAAFKRTLSKADRPTV